MHDVIPLWPDGSPHNPAQASERPRLTLYRPVRSAMNPMAAMIVCPGGGYSGRAAHEGAPFAELFALHGIFGFVLDYRVSPHRFPAPFMDAARAVRLVRHKAGEWGIDPQRVGLMGFSAGGHLAASVATQPDLHREPLDDLADRYSARPDRSVLAYPVISMVAEHHVGSTRNLLGPDASEDLRRQHSHELHVTPQSPPTFLFHTSDDGAVPLSNSLRLATALRAAGVEVEVHSFAHGPHGVGLAMADPNLRVWTTLLMNWLRPWWEPA
jgi:acetyl esterase/lipase